MQVPRTCPVLTFVFVFVVACIATTTWLLVTYTSIGTVIAIYFAVCFVVGSAYAIAIICLWDQIVQHCCTHVQLVANPMASSITDHQIQLVETVLGPEPEPGLEPELAPELALEPLV